MASRGNRLAGKIALVTGAASGIGLAVTQNFLSEGAKVFGVDISEANLKSAGSLLQSQGFESGTYALHRADVADEESVIAFVEKCTNQLGRLDIAVLNAGIGIHGSIAQTTMDDWDRQMRINARGRMCIMSIPILEYHSGRVADEVH
jgi:NAD(P)-dependent dehydrogenase (short-subunit alcohol dehydrogenase family)